MTRLLKEALPSFLFGINFEKQAELGLLFCLARGLGRREYALPRIISA